MPPDELVAALTAAIDETERIALAATPGPWWYNPGKVWLDAAAFEAYERSKGEEFVGYGGPSPFTGCIAATGPASHGESMRNAEHIAHNDPPAALRRVAADRRVLHRHQPRLLRTTPDAPDGYFVCVWCDRRGVDPRLRWPCDDLLDLADRYGIEVEVTDVR